MFKFRLNIVKPLKVVFIITLILLHLLGSLIFEYNRFVLLDKSNCQEQIIKANNNESQSDVAFTKKDNKEFQTFFPDIQKQKSKYYLKHTLNNSFNSLLSHNKEVKDFYIQSVDNKNLNPRSPPNSKS